MNLQDAVFCATLILQGAGIDLKPPLTLPTYSERPVSIDDHMREPRIPDNAVGLFWPIDQGEIVADEWDILVHEAVHDLEYANRVPLREDWAYYAQAHAFECEFRWQTDCPPGMDRCWVASYTPP